AAAASIAQYVAEHTEAAPGWPLPLRLWRAAVRNRSVASRGDSRSGASDRNSSEGIQKSLQRCLFIRCQFIVIPRQIHFGFAVAAFYFVRADCFLNRERPAIVQHLRPDA